MNLDEAMRRIDELERRVCELEMRGPVFYPLVPFPAPYVVPYYTQPAYPFQPYITC